MEKPVMEKPAAPEETDKPAPAQEANKPEEAFAEPPAAEKTEATTTEAAEGDGPTVDRNEEKADAKPENTAEAETKPEAGAEAEIGGENAPDAGKAAEDDQTANGDKTEAPAATATAEVADQDKKPENGQPTPDAEANPIEDEMAKLLDEIHGNQKA